MEDKKIRIAVVESDKNIAQLLKATLKEKLEEQNYEVEFVGEEDAMFAVQREDILSPEQILQEAVSYLKKGETRFSKMDKEIIEPYQPKERFNHKRNKKLDSRSQNFLRRR